MFEKKRSFIERRSSSSSNGPTAMVVGSHEEEFANSEDARHWEGRRALGDWTKGASESYE